MEVVSTCPFPVTSVIWQASSGAWALTLVCKATFRLDAPDAVLAEQQESLNDEDNHWNDDPARSLVAPSDLVPYKPRADVVIVGHAFAPGQTPVRTLTASIIVGQMSKALEVYCDRWFDLEGRVHEGSRFLKMPLRYERAAGGDDSVNPVGLRFDADPDAYGRVLIPNLQPLGAHVGWRGDRFDPIGFGPIAPHWPTRWGKLHQHAHRFSPRDWVKQPLPDIDFAFFNAAPLDQQVDSIRADERITLEHLHRDHARFITRLPGIRPRAVVDRAPSGREELRLVADTLWIDTDRGLCTVVWRGGIGLRHPRDVGTIHVAVEGPGPAAHSQPVAHTAPLAGSPAREAPLAAADPTMTLAPGLVAAPEQTIPFVQSPWVESPYARSEGVERPSEEAGQTLFLSPGMAAAKATLPFPPAAAPAGESAGPRPVMPAPATPAPATAAPTTPAPAPIPAVRPLVSLGSPAMASGNAVVALGTPSDRSLGTRAGEEDTQAGPPPAKELPPPPAMIGPLARPDMELPAEHSIPKPADKAPPEVPVAPKPLSPPPASKADLEEYPIERCAQIAVSIACRPGDTPQILEQHRLSEANWDHVKNHWLAAIRQELNRGRNALLKRYDLAYIEQVEAERGPIGIEEYAKLAVAIERGQTREAMVAMRLPAGAAMRIERVWVERMAKDAMFGEKARAAVDASRVA